MCLLRSFRLSLCIEVFFIYVFRLLVRYAVIISYLWFVVSFAL